MYKFYKIFENGTKKYCDTINSTLDPVYHAYINWCKENDVKWELIRTSDNKIVADSNNSFNSNGVK